MGEESQGLPQQTSVAGISSTSSADQPTVSLAEEEKVFAPFVARMLDEHIRQGERDLRERVAQKTLGIFMTTNFYMLGTLGVVFTVDTALLALGLQNPDQRLINSGVIKALIGATVVEGGALMVIMANWLFPNRAD
jgi:hypothetical protein